MPEQVTGAAAFKQLQVPESGISQSLQYWGGIKARDNAAQRAEAERERVRRGKELERYNVDPKDFDIQNAGFSDLNSANRELATNMLKEYSDLMYDAKQAYNTNETGKSDQLYSKASLIRNRFKNFQNTMGTHKELFDSFIKDSNDGKVSGWSKGFGNFYKGATVKGKFKFGLDKEGDIIRMVEFQDDEGNVKSQVVSDKDVNNGNFRYFLKEDINKLTSDITKDLGDTISQTIKGYDITKRIEWDEGAEGNKGKHSTAARELISARVNSPDFMADMVDQFNLYDKFGIDKNNPPSIPQFTKEQKKEVENRLLEVVKGKYKETVQSTRDNQRYATDVRASLKREELDKQTKEEEVASQLKFDITRAVNDGDYTVLKRRFRPTKDAPEVSVTDVVPSANGQSLTLVMSGGEEPVTITNSETAIAEFVLRNSPEYGKITPQDVIGSDPLQYRGGTIQASDVGASIKDFFNEKGSIPRTKNKGLVRRLRDLGYDAVFRKGWFTDSIILNGKEIELNKDITLSGLTEELKNTTNTEITTESGRKYK